VLAAVATGAFIEQRLTDEPQSTQPRYQNAWAR
jgi:hypothetical protein